MVRPAAQALADQIIAEVERDGPLPFSRFMERALYAPVTGFYEGAGQAGGRRGDFVTSVESGPLFGAVIGDWLDALWAESGHPARFRVAEAAAGVGTLWRCIVRARPACFEALEWTLVERSETLRRSHAGLPGEPRSSAGLPTTAVDVVVANELLDNLVFDIAIQTPHGWCPRQVGVVDGRLRLVTGSAGDWLLGSQSVGADRSSSAGSLVNADSLVSAVEALPAEAPVGAEMPLPIGAVAWLSQARHIADRVVVFDYVASDSELVKRGSSGWLRAYSGHERVIDPIARPGTCDITHDVPVDRLPAADSTMTQGDWLRRHGILERVETARKVWHERGHIGDLEAMFARSAMAEAKTLTDPAGLGGFSVLEWVRPRR